MNNFESILSSAEESANKVILNLEKSEKEDISDWKSIDGKNVLQYDEKKIDFWRTRDLFHFFIDQYKDKFNDDFLIGQAPGCQNLMLVQDALSKHIGYRASLEITRDYIAWYIDNKAEEIVLKYNCFKMKFMKWNNNIEDFFDDYGRDIKIQEKPIGSKSSISDSSIFTESTMSAVYASSCSQFILRYGLVLSNIWLVKNHNMPEQEANDLIINESCKLVKKGLYGKIVESTEKHNPYPEWCNFSIKNMLEELSIETGEFFNIVNVSFSAASNRFSFLKE